MCQRVLLNIVCVHTEALFGRAPFASRSYVELEEKIRSNQPIEVSGQEMSLVLVYVLKQDNSCPIKRSRCCCCSVT